MNMAVMILGAADETASLGPTAAGMLIAAAALAAMASVLVPVLAHRRRRQRAWLSSPQQLLEPMSPSTGWFALTLLAAVATAGLAAQWPQHPVTPVGSLAAALAVLGVFHLRGWWTAREAGLLLVGLTVVTVALAWLPGPNAGKGLAGGAVAGLLFLWLARFWDQQLLDGQPWTTTGRLIPSCQRWATWAAAVVLIGAVYVAPAPRVFGIAWYWIALVALVGLTLRLLGLWRTQRRLDVAGGAVATALTALLIVLDRGSAAA